MMLLVLLWDGFLIMAEGFGLQTSSARRFADVAWLASAALLVLWLAGCACLAVP